LFALTVTLAGDRFLGWVVTCCEIGVLGILLGVVGLRGHTVDATGSR